MRREEEERKRNEPPSSGKTQGAPIARLLVMNFLFFSVVAAGLMWVSGHSLTDLMGPLSTFWVAKDKDESL